MAGPTSNDRVPMGSNMTPPGQPSSCAAMQSSTAIRSLADVSFVAQRSEKWTIGHSQKTDSQN